MIATLTFTETAPAMFSAPVNFADQTIISDGSFSSKKLAMENVCKLANPAIEQFDPNSKRRKDLENSKAKDRFVEDVLNGANWVGTLHSKRFCQ